MTAIQLDFGRARSTDPASSHEAAATAPVKGQRATILGLLRNLEATWAAGAITADALFDKYPSSARGTWSTRLSAMERDGLIVFVGYRVNESGHGRRQRVKAYSLTEAGRIEAGRLLHPSAVMA